MFCVQSIFSVQLPNKIMVCILVGVFSFFWGGGGAKCIEMCCKSLYVMFMAR